ncbi:MAG: Stp1/IreP family PP2C-type Ser/Thr phosphatase [Oscillospiraceae bacterium]|nr:Stp1/IreP family PP2C-type Ser/Thr phosphatase [Oscillospiraceae bacterium]
MFAWGQSDIGKARKDNQDSFAYSVSDAKKLTFAVVCDGMGGAAAGNIASQIAIEEFTQCIREVDSKNLSNDQLLTLLETAVNNANEAVHSYAQQKRELHGMGTTLVGVVATPSKVAVVNIGDSRAYKITSDGITKITRDHSLVEDMVRMGELTDEQAREHPGKNLITRAVGTDRTVTGDVFFPDLHQGDYILLCSDGLSNLVTEQEILYEVIYGGEKSDCCNRLIDIANNRGGFDNITVVLLAF